MKSKSDEYNNCIIISDLPKSNKMIEEFRPVL